jgi:glutathione-regulated potassium-efflux system ancillary protein KefG
MKRAFSSTLYFLPPLEITGQPNNNPPKSATIMAARRVLILFAHPALHKSRVNRRLLDGVQPLAGVTCRDLYEEYPDFNINVKREQAQLLEHDLIVFQHPLFWYSCPAILKEWQDLVLEYGFAYGTGGTRLHGKSFLQVITAGGTVDTYQRQGYNYYSIRELLTPFEQTARLCGLRYLPPFVVPGTNRFQNEAAIEPYVISYRHTIEALRDNLLDPENLSHAEPSMKPSR